MEDNGKIEVIGARVHNLKNISVSMPRKKLTVITGLSGSGKSSLAFDTIFAEGQRRYMETFSSYARPVISIDQKTTSKNPRSTVGTVTEVYDFLRLLFARAGIAYSYLSGKPMVHYTDEQIVELICREYAGKKVLLLAPLVSNRKGHYKELFETIRKKGFVHVRVDGEVQEIVPGMKLDRYKMHSIEVVVDRLKIKPSAISHQPSEGEEKEDLKRLRQSIDRAMTQGNGILMIAALNGEMSADKPLNGGIQYFSRNLMCPETGLSYPEPAPHTFSFNSPSGWCPCCKGLGRIKQSDVSLQNSEEVDEAIREENWWEQLQELSASSDQSSEENEEEKEEWIECPECKGKRLNKEALSYRIGKYNIAELSAMDIDELLKTLEEMTDRGEATDRIQTASLTERQRSIAEPILKEICARLRFMQSVGLSYLSLNRSSQSLSGGESQRIRLATQIGSRLVNVLYILDEPSIGLHQRDNERLIRSLKELRDLGNSVIVVEHDEQMMREADWIIDIGPKAGRLGGKVVFQGTPEELLKTDTLTAEYLKGEKTVTDVTDRAQTASLTDRGKAADRWITLSGCTGNNLKNVTAKIPLGKMVCVTGVSGSGKSSLINQTLYPILSQRFYRSKQAPLPYKKIDGIEHIDKVINVDQSPIGRTPRSNPATYTNVFNDIRELFAQLPESKIRGWKTGRFSFNAKGGRCEECSGNGYKTIQMHFMPDVYVPCEICGGQRYNRETLEVRWKGKTLGQASTSLSGGESQRIKLATELSRPSTGKTLYILDEPTTGLHFEDIRVLLGVLRRLVDKGNTVLIIEHNTDVIRACDWIIDLGPEGGKGGGEIIAEGTIDDIRKSRKSITGKFL